MNYYSIANVAGTIHFDNRALDYYGDEKDPLFLAKDIAKILGYRLDNANHLTDLCEEDEYLRVPVVRSGQKRVVLAITEMGLYNILSQSRMKIARKWRRVVHEELIERRKNKDRSIEDQFDIWADSASNIFFDEETGELMESYILPGGDVGQRPYKA